MNYVQQHNIKNYKFNIDNGFPGDTLDRSDLKRLLSDIEKVKVVRVAVTHDYAFFDEYSDNREEHRKLLNRAEDVLKNSDVEYGVVNMKSKK